MSLIAELKRRNVFKVGTAYLALGWLITEVTSTVAPVLRLPVWTVPMVVWVGVIGFPCVLLFSWVYELTPEGLKRESEIDRSQSITHITSRRLDTIIIVMLALAMLMFAADRFLPRSAQSPAVGAGPIAEGGEATAAVPELAKEEPRQHARTVPAQAPDEKTIAVLPFVNMSEDTGNEYFSDGISEELLNLLAKIPELKVIARTSSFAFKDEKIEIAEIARRLNVANVLEGSVRKSGNRVRITAQLIRTADSTHLWSETYDREMTDIFAVQDELAGAVVAALRLKLLPEQQQAAAQQHAIDPDAYNQVLLGRQLFGRGTPDGSRRAVAAYQKAIARVPDYAAAWAGLALAEYHAAESEDSVAAIEAGQQRAMAAAEKAIALDPQLPDGYVARGWLRWDVAGSLADFARALELDPSNSNTQRRYAVTLAFFGRLPEANTWIRKAVALDPLAAPAWSSLGSILLYSGDRAGAREALQRALEINPESNSAYTQLGALELLEGNPDQALASYQLTSGEMWKAYGTAMAEHSLGHAERSRQALDRLIEIGAAGAAYQIAVVNAWRGETDTAFEWLERAWEQRDGGLGSIKVDPLLASLRDDPRFPAIVAKIGFPP